MTPLLQEVETVIANFIRSEQVQRTNRRSCRVIL